MTPIARSNTSFMVSRTPSKKKVTKSILTTSTTPKKTKKVSRTKKRV